MFRGDDDSGAKRNQGPELEQPNRLVEWRSVDPVMPTQIGIHVFSCCDQQDADGRPSPP
jgi:hypothetical protein